jgi:hypothetical protein
MGQTLYRRPLPSDAIAFSSPEGRHVFAEALATEGFNGYFRLAEEFHTQSDPAFCALGSLLVALNALAIDPERPWKGPWRWFAEDLLDCCVPLAEVRERGLAIDELACLARCNGAEVDVQRRDSARLADWHAQQSIFSICAVHYSFRPQSEKRPSEGLRNCATRLVFPFTSRKSAKRTIDAPR